MDLICRRRCLESIQNCKTLAAAIRIHKSLRWISLGGDVYLQNKLIDMYGRCGSARDAELIFHGIQSRDSYSWELMVMAYCRNGQANEARRMLECAPHCASLAAWTAVLAALVPSSDVADIERLFGRIQNPDLLAWNVILVAYARSGLEHKSRRVFGSMAMHNLVTWTTMVDGCCCCEEAKVMFHSMPEHDVVSCTCVMNACARCGDVEGGVEVVSGMQEHNLLSCTTLVSAYARSGCLEAAERLFHQMPEHDTVSRTALLVAYAQAGALERAKRLFDAIPAHEADTVCWNAMVFAFAAAGELEEAEQAFRSGMQQHNVESWNTILTAEGQLGRVQEAEALFHQMPAKNSVSWNAMLSTYAHNARPHRAKHMFDTMPHRTFDASSAMLAAYTQAGRPDEALELFNTIKVAEMPDDACFALALIASSQLGKPHIGRCHCVSMTFDYGLTPRKQHYCCLVDLLGRAGYWRAALELINHMPFVPDSWDWTSFLSACRGNVQGAEQSLVHPSPNIGPPALVLLANAFSAST